MKKYKIKLFEKEIFIINAPNRIKAWKEFKTYLKIKEVK